jgi:saccharopine dehydrogenase (NAD+, L-lysine-forming)
MAYVTARDLALSPKVTEIVIADPNQKNAEQTASRIKSDKISVRRVNITDRGNLVKALKRADVVTNCIWYAYVMDVIKAAIEAKVPCVDLGGTYFDTLKKLEFNDLAKRTGVTYMLGCGLAPGITNIMARHGANKLDKVHEIHIIGGSPPLKDFEMKFLYSPHTYLAQFTKEAIIFQNGEYKTLPPRSGREYLRLPPPFNQDVEMYYTLHSELATLPHTIEGVKDVDMRLIYSPELIKAFNLFVDCGLTSEDPIQVRGFSVAPYEVLTLCLTKYMDKRGDRIWSTEVIGEKFGVKTRVQIYIISEYQEAWGVAGVGYATGVAASIACQMLAKGDVKMKGVVPPEVCIKPQSFFEELNQRGIPIYETVETIRKVGGEAPASKVAETYRKVGKAPTSKADEKPRKIRKVRFLRI